MPQDYPVHQSAVNQILIFSFDFLRFIFPFSISGFSTTHSPFFLIPKLPFSETFCVNHILRKHFLFICTGCSFCVIISTYVQVELYFASMIFDVPLKMKKNQESMALSIFQLLFKYCAMF